MRRPQDAQADVVAEIEARVDDLLRPQMTDGQRSIVTARLTEPREYVSLAEVSALLRRSKSRDSFSES